MRGSRLSSESIGPRGEPSIACRRTSHATRVLGEGPSPRDLRSADENLEGTYLVHMFAEFETGVRSFWRAIKPRARTQAEVLLDQVGDRCKIPADVIRIAHSTRKYRNNLLHDREEEVEVVTVSVAQRCFQRYLSRLPNDQSRGQTLFLFLSPSRNQEQSLTPWPRPLASAHGGSAHGAHRK